VTIRTRLKRLEQLTPPPPRPEEPASQFFARPEVKAALNADPEFLAAQRLAYNIICDAFESAGERPPADFLADWPYSELTRARRSRDPELRAWAKDCRPEAERIWAWMEQTPGFDCRAWITERRPDFRPAWTRWVIATKVVLRKFGRTE
jgi:hypothetical protein